jgi:pimeloyl-ACP methyl ester carboxylesterase
VPRVAATVPLSPPAEFRLPRLILHGKRGGAIPQSFALRAAEQIPRVGLEFLHSGHFLPLNIPVLVSDSLREFFR